MDPIFHFLPDAPKPVAPYSHAVEAGPFVFVTGQLATDPDDDRPRFRTASRRRPAR
jgi:2-iminobutanoate/2-iminopropanoate deaminase